MDYITKSNGMSSLHGHVRSITSTGVILVRGFNPILIEFRDEYVLDSALFAFARKSGGGVLRNGTMPDDRLSSASESEISTTPRKFFRACVIGEGDVGRC